MGRRGLLIGLLVLPAAGCALALPPAAYPMPHACPDGAPPRILQDPSCPRGRCGYSCLPGRWDEAVDISVNVA